TLLYFLAHYFFFFFFSSRRRHTRFSRDWSSDVCSSDLEPQLRALAGANPRRGDCRLTDGRRNPSRRLPGSLGPLRKGGTRCARRSEERRVGKERRTRWSPGQ